MWTLVSVGIMAFVGIGLVVFLLGFFGELGVTSVRQARGSWLKLAAAAIAFGIMGGLVALSFVF